MSSTLILAHNDASNPAVPPMTATATATNRHPHVGGGGHRSRPSLTKRSISSPINVPSIPINNKVERSSTLEHQDSTTESSAIENGGPPVILGLNSGNKPKPSSSSYTEGSSPLKRRTLSPPSSVSLLVNGSDGIRDDTLFGGEAGAVGGVVHAVPGMGLDPMVLDKDLPPRLSNMLSRMASQHHMSDYNAMKRLASFNAQQQQLQQQQAQQQQQAKGFHPNGMNMNGNLNHHPPPLPPMPPSMAYLPPYNANRTTDINPHFQPQPQPITFTPLPDSRPTPPTALTQLDPTLPLRPRPVITPMTTTSPRSQVVPISNRTKGEMATELEDPAAVYLKTNDSNPSSSSSSSSAEDVTIPLSPVPVSTTDRIDDGDTEMEPASSPSRDSDGPGLQTKEEKDEGGLKASLLDAISSPLGLLRTSLVGEGRSGGSERTMAAAGADAGANRVDQVPVQVQTQVQGQAQAQAQVQDRAPVKTSNSHPMNISPLLPQEIIPLISERVFDRTIYVPSSFASNGCSDQRQRRIEDHSFAAWPQTQGKRNTSTNDVVSEPFTLSHKFDLWSTITHADPLAFATTVPANFGQQQPLQQQQQHYSNGTFPNPPPTTTNGYTKIPISPTSNNRLGLRPNLPKVGNLLLSSCPGKKVRLGGMAPDQPGNGNGSPQAQSQSQAAAGQTAACLAAVRGGRSAICRDLRTDLERWRMAGARAIVCCLDDQELKFLGAPWEEYDRVARELGLDVVRIPIAEGFAPPSPAYLDFHLSNLISNYTLKGHSFLVHCRGGVGRAGLVACSWMVKMGFVQGLWSGPGSGPDGLAGGGDGDGDGDGNGRCGCEGDVDSEVLNVVERVIEIIRRRRSIKAIETPQQVHFILEYANYLRREGRVVSASDIVPC